LRSLQSWRVLPSWHARFLHAEPRISTRSRHFDRNSAGRSGRLEVLNRPPLVSWPSSRIGVFVGQAAAWQSSWYERTNCVERHLPVETMMRVRRFAREHGIFAAVAIALVGWLLRDAWLRGYVLGQTDVLFGLIPWKPYAPPAWRVRMPLLSDAAVVFYPFLHFAREAIRSAHFPSWAPAMGGGRPFFAAFQSAVLSPFTIPDYLLPFPWSMAVDTGLRLLVGGVGMYALLRWWGVTAAAALFGGIAYLLNP